MFLFSFSANATLKDMVIYHYQVFHVFQGYFPGNK